MSTPETCPNCGADVPPRARACPECGADEKTGWSEDAYASGLDLPEENFNYDEYVKKEFGPKKHIPEGIHWVWWLAAVLLLGAFISFWVFR
jgi:hypothetical protein